MRRVGLVLAGLGTCLIVFAVLMPTWVSNRVLKFPLNEYASVILTGDNASYFSAAKLTEMNDVNMEATYTIKGNAAAGSSSTAVWNQFVYVYDQSNQLPVQTMTRTFAFDRRTALLVDCCGAHVNGDSSIQQRGYVGYVLPIGTQKQTYDVFDTNLNRPEPFNYAGTDAVGGTEAYRFVENVSPTQNGTQTVPGSLVGMSQATVTLPQYYEAHVTYWIDPITGALLNVTQNEKLTLRDPSGSRQLLVLFNANLAATPDSVDSLVALDNSQLSKMSLVRTLLPLVTGILGVIALIVGIVLARRARKDDEVGASTADSELAAAEPEAARSEVAGDRLAQSATQPSLVPGLDDEAHEATAESAVVKEQAQEEVEEEAREEAAKEEAKAGEPATAQAETAQAETAQAETDQAGADQAGATQAEAESPESEAAGAAGVAGVGAAAGAAAAEAKAAEADTAEPEAKAAEADTAEPEAKAAEAEAEAPAEPEAPPAEAPPAEAPPAEASKAEAAEAPAESAAAEAPVAEAKADTAQAPAAEAAPAAQAAEAETGDAKAEAASAEAPTAEMPAAAADAPAASRRARRGTHRR